MERFDVAYAREHLPELLERAARSEDVSIVDPQHGRFELRPAALSTDERANFAGPPILGQWAGRVVVPARLFEPLTDEELEWLSAEKSE